jgi:hypothetical protein
MGENEKLVREVKEAKRKCGKQLCSRCGEPTNNPTRIHTKCDSARRLEEEARRREEEIRELERKQNLEKLEKLERKQKLEKLELERGRKLEKLERIRAEAQKRLVAEETFQLRKKKYFQLRSFIDDGQLRNDTAAWRFVTEVINQNIYYGRTISPEQRRNLATIIKKYPARTATPLTR